MFLFKNPNRFSLLISLIILSVLYGISVQVTMVWMAVFGYTALVLPAFLLGFSAATVTYLYKGVNLLSGLISSLFVSLITLTGFLVLGLWGLLPVLMVAPLQIGLVIAGALLAYIPGKYVDLHRNTALAGSLLILTMPLFAFLEVQEDNFAPNVRAAQSFTEINATKEKVWSAVDSTTTLPDPDEWYFRWGAGYPMHIETEGEGIGAWRYDEFPTGIYAMNVTHWDEPRKMRFAVQEQPVPLMNLNPFYGELPTDHLRQAIYSIEGEFYIMDTDEGVVLRTTSRYHNGLVPAFYWGPVIDRIISEIHRQILEEVKRNAEAKYSAMQE